MGKLELKWSFGMNLEGDFQEADVPPNLELLVTFGMSPIHNFTLQ
jgi:hypothetical protein